MTCHLVPCCLVPLSTSLPSPET